MLWRDPLAWISNYIDSFQWNIMEHHPCHIFNGGLRKPPLKLGHGWRNTSTFLHGCELRTHAPTLMLFFLCICKRALGCIYNLNEWRLIELSVPNNDLEPLFMMTSSNGNIFRVTGHLCGEFTGLSEFPAQRPVTRSFDVFFDLSLNKRLSKQSRGWWFETQSRPLWRHCNVLTWINVNHGTDK